MGLQQKVDGIIKKMGDSKELPKDLDEVMAFAVQTELRRRDTQASFTKQQQENSRLKAENNILAQNWEQDTVKTLTSSQQAELEELKVSDPDKWRTKITEYEQANAEEFKDRRQKVTEKAVKETELERRTRLLAEYNESNPEHQLTDEAIADEVPPKYVKQLEAGEIDFDQFLDKASSYIQTPKVVGDTTEVLESQPDLSDVGGSNTPSDEALNGESSESYQTETY